MSAAGIIPGGFALRGRGELLFNLRGARRCSPASWLSAKRWKRREGIWAGFGEKMFKIMAVEDSAATLDFYREFFGEAGFGVKTAEDAFSAITLYQQFKPDLVILDLGIPAGGGMLVFNTLRTN